MKKLRGLFLQASHPELPNCGDKDVLLSPTAGVCLSSESEVLMAQSRPTLCSPMDSPWNSPDHNTGVGSLSLQGIFSTQELNPGLSGLQADSLPAEP